MNTNAYPTEYLRHRLPTGHQDSGKTQPVKTLPVAQCFRKMISLLCAVLLCASITPQALSQSLAPASPETAAISSEQFAHPDAVQEKDGLNSGVQSPTNAHSSTRTRLQGGWYIGMELGVAFAPGMKVFGMDTDVATTCDGFFVTPSGNPEECDPPPAEWSNELDAGQRRLCRACPRISPWGI